MTRRYIVFGSDDKINWEEIGVVTAGGAPQALRQAINKEKHRHYFTVSEGNRTAVTPEVEERPPIMKLTPMTPGQLSIADVPRDDDDDDEPQ